MGMGGDDTLVGDTVDSSGGNDTLMGGAGDDTLNGALSGENMLMGGDRR